MMRLALLLSILFVASVVAFKPLNPIQRRSLVQTKMTIENEEDNEPMPQVERNDPSFFESNRRVRLGRSRDQDGKSNIWSIEPKMEVEDEIDNKKTNLFVVGGVFAAVALALPAFVAFTKILPDASDY